MFIILAGELILLRISVIWSLTSLLVALSSLSEQRQAACFANTTTTQHRTHTKTRHHRRYRYGSWFVPPPPAYMPTVFPEFGAQASDQKDPVPKKAENPYRKYIYSRQESDAPKPIRSHKGVTVWSQRS
jgi:hypothetical protein